MGVWIKRVARGGSYPIVAVGGEEAIRKRRTKTGPREARRVASGRWSFRLEPDRMLAATLYRDPTLGGVHNGEPLVEVLQRVGDPEVELHTASDENESAIFDLLIFGRRKKQATVQGVGANHELERNVFWNRGQPHEVLTQLLVVFLTEIDFHFLAVLQLPRVDGGPPKNADPEVGDLVAVNRRAIRCRIRLAVRMFHGRARRLQ